MNSQTIFSLVMLREAFLRPTTYRHTTLDQAVAEVAAHLRSQRVLMEDSPFGIQIVEGLLLTMRDSELPSAYLDELVGAAAGSRAFRSRRIIASLLTQPGLTAAQLATLRERAPEVATAALLERWWGLGPEAEHEVLAIVARLVNRDVPPTEVLCPWIKGHPGTVDWGACQHIPESQPHVRLLLLDTAATSDQLDVVASRRMYRDNADFRNLILAHPATPMKHTFETAVGYPSPTVAWRSEGEPLSAGQIATLAHLAHTTNLSWADALAVCETVLNDTVQEL